MGDFGWFGCTYLDDAAAFAAVHGNSLNLAPNKLCSPVADSEEPDRGVAFIVTRIINRNKITVMSDPFFFAAATVPESGRIRRRRSARALPFGAQQSSNTVI